MDYRREGICEDVENRTIRPTLDQTCQVVEDGDVDRPTAAPSPDKHASESSTTRGRVTVGFSSLAREVGRAGPADRRGSRHRRPCDDYERRPSLPSGEAARGRRVPADQRETGRSGSSSSVVSPAACIQISLPDPAAQGLVRDPEILATGPIDLPDSRTSRTASSRNSHGYAGRILPIVDSLPRACAPQR